MRLSANTQAILLLTAPLLVGKGGGSANTLANGDYRKLAQRLRDLGREPGDLLGPDSETLLSSFEPAIGADRVKRLLDRGFQLSQAFDRWESRAIWVLSRADSRYPKCLKAKCKEDAPPVLYGCGDDRLLDRGGLAIVGSRNADDASLRFTEEVSRLAAQAGRSIVSGGARGVDQAAIRGALVEGGNAVGVLADSLERAALHRENREFLMDGRLALVSPFDPTAGFNVGNAMQRNRYIYALAEAALVVQSDFQKGGTWAGAAEQLQKLKFVPIYVRSTPETNKGLEGLRRLGAAAWPNPASPDEFAKTLGAETSFGSHRAADTQFEIPFIVSEDVPSTRGSAPLLQVPESPMPANPAPNFGESLLQTVRAFARTLESPSSEEEVAALLGITRAQAKEWLHRLVEEGLIEKTTRPTRYRSVRSNPDLFHSLEASK